MNALALGTHVNVHDGDDRKVASGYVNGVASYHEGNGNGSLIRGYTVLLDSAFRGYVDSEVGGTYITSLVCHPDALRRSEA
jgi:hypothetical protein